MLSFRNAAALLALGLGLPSLAAHAQQTTYNAAQDFSDKNPSGPWGYGSGVVGGEFVAFPSYKNDQLQRWIDNKEEAHSVFKNAGAQPVAVAEGLKVVPGVLVLHPGNGKDHLSILRFTAPTDGTYAISAKWTTLDEQAKKTWTWVYTNAQGAEGKAYDVTPKGFKEIHTVGLEGFNKSTSFDRTLALKKGEVLSFEVGNGGDGYEDDAVKTDVVITASPPAPVAVTFEGKYRLKTEFRGDGECLESNQSTSSNKSGASYMDKCQNVTGQYWMIIPDGKDFYRLKTEFRGDGECLESNQSTASFKGGASYMDKCQNVTGQRWKLVKL